MSLLNYTIKPHRRVLTTVYVRGMVNPLVGEVGLLAADINRSLVGVFIGGASRFEWEISDYVKKFPARLTKLVREVTGKRWVFEVECPASTRIIPGNLSVALVYLRHDSHLSDREVRDIESLTAHEILRLGEESQQVLGGSPRIWGYTPAVQATFCRLHERVRASAAYLKTADMNRYQLFDPALAHRLLPKACRLLQRHGFDTCHVLDLIAYHKPPDMRYLLLFQPLDLQSNRYVQDITGKEVLLPIDEHSALVCYLSRHEEGGYDDDLDANSTYNLCYVQRLIDRQGGLRQYKIGAECSSVFRRVGTSLSVPYRDFLLAEVPGELRRRKLKLLL